MRARFATSWLVLALTASFGCAGGSTGDFTGGAVDAADCSSVRFEGEGDEPALGFSMTDILAATEGRFDVPVRWTSPCDEEEAEPNTPCDRASTFVEAWAGSETTVHLEITSDGSEAEVHYPTDDERICAQRMLIPVELRLESDDGMLDKTAEVTVWSECGTDSSVEVRLPIVDAGGALADLPPSWSLVISLGFHLDRMWFGVDVGPTGRGPVLTTDLPPFGERSQDVPRTSVELQEGATLPDESFCEFAF